MSSNDVVLVDTIRTTWSAEHGLDERPEDESFELFVSSQIMAPRGVAMDTVERAIVDGTGDGGVDAAFILLDGEVIESAPDEIDLDASEVRRGVELELVLVQSKLQTGFSENELSLVRGNLADLLDLTKDREELEGQFNSAVLDKIFLFRGLWQLLLTRRPEVSIHLFFATRGATTNVHQRVAQEVTRVREALEACISGGSATVTLLGARELCDMANTAPSYDRQVVAREYFADGESYVCLIGLPEYFDLVTEDGDVIRHLFDQNVRDWEGNVAVNNAIAETLDEGTGPEFWWLNNGVTIICDRVTAAGKTLVIEGVQVVNGQQTSISIAQHLNDAARRDGEQRSVLVRVVQTSDPAVRDAIIRATNKQTPVPEAALRSTDAIHRDIESYFLGRGLYYERRKNHYRNQGKPAGSLVSVSYLAQAVSAIGFSDPGNARARPSSLLKNDQTYERLFNDITMPTYEKIARLQLEVDRILKTSELDCGTSERTNVRYYVSMVLAARAAGNKVVHPQQLANVDLTVDTATVQSALEAVREVLSEKHVETGDAIDKIAKGSSLTGWILDRVASTATSPS